MIGVRWFRELAFVESTIQRAIGTSSNFSSGPNHPLSRVLCDTAFHSLCYFQHQLAMLVQRTYHHHVPTVRHLPQGIMTRRLLCIGLLSAESYSTRKARSDSGCHVYSNAIISFGDRIVIRWDQCGPHSSSPALRRVSCSNAQCSTSVCKCLQVHVDYTVALARVLSCMLGAGGSDGPV